MTLKLLMNKYPQNYQLNWHLQWAVSVEKSQTEDQIYKGIVNLQKCLNEIGA